MLNTHGIVSHAPSSRRVNRASEKKGVCKGQGAGAVPRKGGCPHGAPTKRTVNALSAARSPNYRAAMPG